MHSGSRVCTDSFEIHIYVIICSLVEVDVDLNILYVTLCGLVRQARGGTAECCIQCRLNEGFVQVAPDVESVCFIFTFLDHGPYIFWSGWGVYNISGKCCGLVPFK